MRVPHFGKNNVFLSNNLSKNIFDKPGYYMTIRRKTPEIFKLILRVEAGLEHKVR